MVNGKKPNIQGISVIFVIETQIFPKTKMIYPSASDALPEVRPLNKSNIQVRLFMTAIYPLYSQRREQFVLISVDVICLFPVRNNISYLSYV